MNRLEPCCTTCPECGYVYCRDTEPGCVCGAGEVA